MKIFSLLRIPMTILLIAAIFFLSPFNNKSDKKNSLESDEFYRASVTEVLKSDSPGEQKVKVVVEEGKYKGQKFTIDNTLTTNDQLLPLKYNDELLLSIQNSNGNNLNVTIYQYIRDKKLLCLVLFFMLLILIIGGIKGLYAISSIAFTVCVISILLLPGLVSGYDPIKLTILCSFIIAFFSLIIQNGFSKKTFASLIGTLGGVIISGITTIIMSKYLQISINSEDFMHLSQIPQKINFNFQAILFSSIVIGALGANIDMSMSVATAMNEIRENNRSISPGELINCGMNVGKDVIGTMSNTLILAYVGSSLVSLMFFMAYNVNFMYVINIEDISIEILKSLAGSIGIILSVPLTVFARAFMD